MPSRIRHIILCIASLMSALCMSAQIDTEQVMRIGQNNLYFEDYVLSIQYFNRVIAVKPYLARPYFLRSVAKLNLEDYLGAEADASLAIERNPFITDAWEVRGVARQNMGNLRGAIDDYDKALEMMPDSRGLLFNKAMAQEDLGNLAGADSTLTHLLARFPGFDSGYLGRARLRLEMADTVGAVADIDRALEINKNAVNGYVMRADVAISSERDYEKALADMDRAIKLQPKYAGFFINRAFLRYMTDDFNGAFADYDYALQLDPDNTAAIFNRGLLRSEVHDTDAAIKDFTTVLEMDPDDYKALYNRAIILSETGRLDAAIADLDRLIEAFPDFAAAYFVRFDARRRKGDEKSYRAAQKDYDKSMALAKTDVQLPPALGGKADSDSVTVGREAPRQTQEQIKRRFSSLTTISDNTQPEQVFNSREIRGRVQDHTPTVELEPMFTVTYYTSPTELKMSGDYVKEVDEANATRALRFVLQVTCHEPSTTDEETARRHFESVAYYNSYLAGHTPRAIDYLGRAMDFMTLRDYESAIADLDRAVAVTPDFTLAYLIRSIARWQMAHLHGAGSAENARMLVRAALDDLDKVTELSPRMAVAHYNKGVILATEGDHTSALMELTRAIDLKPDMGEAYYNRGYVYLTLGRRDEAFDDLSRAGALGIVPSYSLLKRMAK